jgi:hypothetical protein
MSFTLFYMQFRRLQPFLEILERKQNSGKRKAPEQRLGSFWPTASRASPGPSEKPAHGARPNGTACMPTLAVTAPGPAPWHGWCLLTGGLRGGVDDEEGTGRVCPTRQAMRSG